jgi:ArsR family transcriptional regulator
MLTQQTEQIFEAHAELCRAIANPKRLMIIDLLSRSEMTVGGLARTIDASSSTVSQHLRLLRDREIVEVRRDGKEAYYRLANPDMVEACRIIRGFLLERMKQQGSVPQELEMDDLLAPAGTI